jgi:hypothetical protein
MKILSRILSLLFSDMKPDDISVELIFIILILKSQTVLLVTLYKRAMTVFNCTHNVASATAPRHFTLCHKV